MTLKALPNLANLSSSTGRGVPELMKVAGEEKQRYPGKPRSNSKQETKIEAPPSEDDSEDPDDSDDTNNKTEKRNRREIDYKALGFLRARLHSLEEALAIEHQLQQLNLVQGAPTADLYTTNSGVIIGHRGVNATSPISSVPSSPSMDNGSHVTSAAPSSPLTEAPDSNDSAMEEENSEYREDSDSTSSTAGMYTCYLLCQALLMAKCRAIYAILCDRRPTEQFQIQICCAVQGTVQVNARFLVHITMPSHDSEC